MAKKSTRGRWLNGFFCKTRLVMTRLYIVAIAAGLLLAVSGTSFAAKRISDTKHAVKTHSKAAASRASVDSGSTIRPYIRDPYPYSQDDPYAPGVNWPGHW